MQGKVLQLLDDLRVEFVVLLKDLLTCYICLTPQNQITPRMERTDMLAYLASTKATEWV